MGKYSGLELLTAKFWQPLPHVSEHDRARRWVERLARSEMADKTVDGYAKDVENFLAWCAKTGIEPATLTPDQADDYIDYLARLRNRRKRKIVALANRAKRAAAAPLLSRKTLNRRLIAVRKFFNYLAAYKQCEFNPFLAFVTEKTVAGKAFRFSTSAEGDKWIPTEAEWFRIHAVLHSPYCTLRDRLMLHLQYDCALRIEELLAVELDHFHFGEGRKNNYLYVPPSKGRKTRNVPFTDAVVNALVPYLERRRSLTAARGALFISESNRNFGEPLKMATWFKKIKKIGALADCPRLVSHTMRHLCLTDLARNEVDILYISTFAGHKSLESTKVYIQLAARDIAGAFVKSMGALRAWRSEMFMREVIQNAS